MSNLFPNSPILVIEKQQQLSPKAAKKKKAHRRRQQHKIQFKKVNDDDAKVKSSTRTKASKSKKNRAERKKYKALVKSIKKQSDAANKEAKKSKKQKKRKEEKKSDKKDEVLPEELAYKKSLRLNRKDHAKIAETLLSRQATHTTLVEKLDSLRTEAANKRRLRLIHGPLPEERAYRLAIGQQPDAYLDPTLE